MAFEKLGGFLYNLLSGIGVSEADMPNAIKNMTDFSNQVRHIESDNEPTAAAKSTTAKGVYQFTDASVKTGKQRLKNMFKKLKLQGYNEDNVDNISDNPQDWDDDEADAMFYGNIFAQKGSNRELKEIAKGNKKARRDAYYQYHHTDADEATIERTEEFIPIDSVEVDDTMMDYNNTNTF